MKSNQIIFLLLIIVNLDSKISSQDIVTNIEQDIFPFQIVLMGMMREIEDVENAVPRITLNVDKDTIRVHVGYT